MIDKANPLQDMIDRHTGQQFEAPMAYYEEKFAAADPEALAARTGIAFARDDAQDGATADAGTFSLNLLGRPLSVSWPALALRYVDTGDVPDEKVHIIVADLLLNGRLVPSAGTWKAYAEVPWGEHYLKAFQGRCIGRLAYMFKDRASFRNACEALGGRAVEGNDGYYEFEFVDGVKVRLAVWEADDEFGPTAQILFSDNAPLAFSAEDLAAVGDILLGALKKARPA